jgi:hypothetical protein
MLAACLVRGKKRNCKFYKEASDMNRITGTAVGLFILGAAILCLPAWGIAGPILKGEAVGTHVHCGGAVTIGSALGRAQPIRAHGLCRETISIADTRVNITILGDGGGDNRTAEDGGPASPLNACDDPRNTLIVGDDPTAAQIIQVRGRNITITGVEIFGVRADDPSVSPPISGNIWDPALCPASPPLPGAGTSQDTGCNNNRGIRAQRGGILLIGRNQVKGDFGGTVDPKHYIEQSGVCIRDLSKNGIEANQSSTLRIINSEVTNVGGDGINLTDVSAANIGSSSGSELNLPSDPFEAPGHAGPNIFHNNAGVGITVDRHSQARIVGNYIHDNGAEGIRVRRHSQADVASNLIDKNLNGIRVDDNSNVSLGTVGNPGCEATSYGFLCPTHTAIHSGTFVKQDTLANSTSAGALNTSFGIKCTVGGSVSGLASVDRSSSATNKLSGVGGAKSFGSFGVGTNDNCIDKTN